MFSGANNLSRYSSRNVIIWMALAFQAGAVNAGGFLACHRFVTHTTGFATHFGAEFAQGHYLSAVSLASVPLFFLAGCMFSAYFVDQKINHDHSRYDFLIAAIAFLLLLVTAIGAMGGFGTFGEAYEYHVNYLLLALLATAMGVQNAAITSASGAVIRTTHLTGITTDLGIGLIRVFSKHIPENIRAMEQKATGTRLGLISSFIAGSTVSAFFFLRYQYLGFAIPAGTCIGILLFAKLTTRTPRSEKS